MKWPLWDRALSIIEPNREFYRTPSSFLSIRKQTFSIIFLINFFPSLAEYFPWTLTSSTLTQSLLKLRTSLWLRFFSEKMTALEAGTLSIGAENSAVSWVYGQGTERNLCRSERSKIKFTKISAMNCITWLLYHIYQRSKIFSIIYHFCI